MDKKDVKEALTKFVIDDERVIADEDSIEEFMEKLK